MDEAEFEQLLAQARATHPQWFDSNDRTAVAAQDIAAAEAELGIQFPEQYKAFVQAQGAGRFVFTSVLPPTASDRTSVLSIKARYLLGHAFIPLSDDGTGGYYGTLVVDGRCSQTVHYLDPDESDPPTQTDASFLAFVARDGLRTSL